MSKEIYTVTKITPNSHMGKEYWDGNCIFFFGDTLKVGIPDLKIGDTVKLNRASAGYYTKEGEIITEATK